MLTIKEKRIKIIEVPVKVLKLNVYEKPFREKYQHLKCTCCEKSLENKGWGIAHIEKQNNKKIFARLCYDCTIKAGGVFYEQ